MVAPVAKPALYLAALATVRGAAVGFDVIAGHPIVDSSGPRGQKRDGLVVSPVEETNPLRLRPGGEIDGCEFVERRMGDGARASVENGIERVGETQFFLRSQRRREDRAAS